MSNKVIVFGPTGNVGGFAAITAHAKGAEVFLAMRDPGKNISTLSAEDEKRGGFQRVQADLTDPKSVLQAVKQTGATSAFFYLAFGQPDHMEASIKALKDGGVRFVVFLSSFTVQGDLESIPASELISFAHAQVEINLVKIFGQENFVALRPGGFATNAVTWWRSQILAGEVRLFRGDVAFDGITPDDMGKVAGTILAKGEQGGQNFVYLFGPDMVTQNEQLKIIEGALRKEIKIVPVEPDEAQQGYLKAGMPPPMASYLIGRLAAMDKGGIKQGDQSLYEEGVANIEKYTGQPPLSFRDWVGQNTNLFKA